MEGQTASAAERSPDVIGRLAAWAEGHLGGLFAAHVSPYNDVQKDRCPRTSPGFHGAFNAFFHADLALRPYAVFIASLRCAGQRFLIGYRRAGYIRDRGATTLSAGMSLVAWQHV
jgi:hypothetical protein